LIKIKSMLRHLSGNQNQMKYKEKLISDLKGLRDDINLLKNMFGRIEPYKHIAINAMEKTDSLLFELTGNVFYRRDKAMEDRMSDNIESVKEPRKWSWAEFAIGFLNKKLIVFSVSTVIVFFLLFKVVDADPVFRWIMGGGWLLLGIIFMLSNSIEKAIENSKITLELKAGAQANMNAEMSKVIEAAVSIIQGGKNENRK